MHYLIVWLLYSYLPEALRTRLQIVTLVKNNDIRFQS
jgi:hypothetical protein